MSEGNSGTVDLRKIRRLLKETARLAEHASLTGSLGEGARASVAQYNATLQYLEKAGAVPAGFFLLLADDANLGELGVAAAQLAAYIEEDEAPPHPPQTPNAPNNSFNISVGDVHGLKDIGEVIREHLPDWMRKKETSADEQRAKAAEDAAAASVTFNDVESRVAEVGANLQAVAEQLRRGDLTSEQRAALAEQLSALGTEQLKLARQHALIRDRAEAVK